MAEQIRVYREIQGAYQPVGGLSTESGSLGFSYDDDYLDDPSARSISASLPLRTGAFDEKTSRAYFDGLLPEGMTRRAFADALHVGYDDVMGLVAHLNNESAGALVFADAETDPTSTRSYEPLDFAEIATFARSPRAKALELDMASRLSLAGAQTKIGLYHRGSSLEDGWFLPKGSAPSTHILKAADGTFEGQSVNEALCLKTMEYLGFDTARAQLLPVEDAEPVLVVTRFDRSVSEGNAFPHRQHQFDFAQELSLPSDLKYEPTDGHYASLSANLISRESSDPFGDRMMFFSRLLTDWALGNCDNHLKNHSLLLDGDWSTCSLSPVYDVTCTTIYPQLAREMGVGLCDSRRIDDVTRETIRSTAGRMGINEKMADREIESILEQFPVALDRAEQLFLDQSFPEASALAEYIRKDFKRRSKL